MNDWAIVVGVDHYPASASWTLRGAVRDALAMRDWLLSPQGANIAPDHLTLLLGLAPGTPAPAANVIDATYDNLLTAIGDLFARSGKQGDRFFFHFSGHGLSVKERLSWKQGILANDFSLTTPHKSLTVTSLFEAFQRTAFKQQFFVIDACRNIPLEGILLSDFPYEVKPPVIPAFPQFVMYATQPGVEAVEVGFPGDESGAFTSALLKGLKNGDGAAKTWDDDSGEYVVRWNELFAAVFEDVRNRKLQVNALGNGPIIQEPRQYGERNNENPELARFPEASFPHEELLIDLAPSPTVLQVASVTVNWLGGVAKDVRPPITTLPIVARLPPRTYGVNGAAAGYRPMNPKSVRLYAPAKVTLEFQKVSPGAPPPASGVSTGPVSPAPAAPMNQQPKGGLEVSAQESVAMLQVANEAGTIVATGRGRIVMADLPPGFYSLRLVSPEGAVISEAIESPTPGGIRRVTLSARPETSPAMQYLIEYAGFEREPDGAISPSETVGPTFFLKTSTVLALAAAAQLEPQSPYGFHLRKVPLPGFHQLVGMDVPSGVHVVFGDERLGDERLRHERLGDERREAFLESARVLDISSREPREMRHEPSDSRLLRSFALAARAGSPRVRLEWLGHKVTVPCYVLPGRVTLIVITREMDGSIEFHQYMPPSGVPDAAALEDPASRGRDPFYGGSAFAVIRRIEYMQRTFAHGRLSPLKPDIDLLLDSKWIDPIAGCLGCYLALRMRMTEGLDIATTNLVRYFGGLPDAHILRGTYLLETGRREDALEEFHQAIALGPPIFREGATLLADKARSLPFDDGINAVLIRRPLELAGGELWSMWLSQSDSNDQVQPDIDPVQQRLAFLKQRGVKDPDLDLMLAAYVGDAPAAKAALEEGANPNIRDTELLERYEHLLREF